MGGVQGSQVMGQRHDHLPPSRTPHQGTLHSGKDLFQMNNIQILNYVITCN